jgi:hypothetical protein
MSALILVGLAAIGLLLAPLLLVFAMRAAIVVVPAVVLLVLALLAAMPHRPRTELEGARRPAEWGHSPR